MAESGDGAGLGVDSALCVALVFGRGVLPAALEALAFAVHLQDGDVVGETVQQRLCQLLRAEDLDPLVESRLVDTMMEPRS